MEHPWSTSGVALSEALGVDLGSGLPKEGVVRSRTQYGQNHIEDHSSFSFIRSFVRELQSPLSLVLVMAGLVAFFVGDAADTFVIVVALLINLSVSLWQEGSAAHVFSLLQKETQHTALVIRDGKEIHVPSEELVVGDVLVLVGGARVGADARIFEIHELAANESALTGEWTAQKKTVNELPLETKTQERTNMVYAGTYIAEGHGKALVTEVGPRTQFGSLAMSATETIERPTPLQDKLHALSRTILLVIAVITACIFALGILRGFEPGPMLLLALAVGVAAMPEGLPAVMTVVLSEGMRQILAKGGLVKRLVSAETFGSVTTIITDKTGTLTTGAMHFSGIVTADGTDDDTTLSPVDTKVLEYAVRASDAFIEEKDGEVTFNGRALEVAIIAGGYKHGIDIRNIKEGHERITLVQFESKRRYAISLNNHPEDGARMYLTGSPEHIMAVCSYALTKDGVVPLTPELQEYFTQQQNKAAEQGKNLTGIGFRRAQDKLVHDDVVNPEHGERLGFVFAGLMLFEDTIRTDVVDAIARARDAGVKVIMATGDHQGTALYVAEKVGLIDETHWRVITGSELETMDDNAIIAALAQTRVFARALPQHKMRLAHILQAEGEVVAMTGDGINDAPALIAADIGVTLSTGTDIAKEASDLVLTKNSFSVIIDAIREGRRAIANIKTIVTYLLSMSFATVVLIGGALAFNIPLPLLPAQILWTNIVVEGFMSFPFAKNHLRASAMKERPLKRSESLFTQRQFAGIFLIALLKGSLLLAFFVFLAVAGVGLESARIALFLALCIGAIIASASFLDLEAPLWRSVQKMHRSYLAALVVSLLLLWVGTTVKPFSLLLATQGIEFGHLLWALIIGVFFMGIVEIVKPIYLRTVGRDTIA